MDIKELREKIDNIDSQITELFCRRMEICGDVAEAKRDSQLSVFDMAREREILTRVGKLSGEPFDIYTRMLYSVMFGLSRSYQVSRLAPETELTKHIAKAAENTPKVFPSRGTVACQGVEGAYSQMACDKLFAAPDIVYFRSFEGVFQAVEQGLCDFGLLPIENSSNGSVNGVYDLMHKHNFYIVRSIRLHVEHNLLAAPGVKLSDVREIISHEQALGQCSVFLGAHPEIKVTVCENTAEAAKLVAQSGRRDIAAISSRNCAKLYGLETLSEKVQNSENNYTRFICIAKDLAIYPGADKISLMVTLEHRPGALYRMIAKFAALGLDLTKIESRPIPGRDFEFMFYFDLTASVWSPEVLSLLGECGNSDEAFIFLGSYSELG